MIQLAAYLAQHPFLCQLAVVLTSIICAAKS
jgi:hypothetical protein